MDPINYLPHGSQRLASHSDTVHGPAGSWVTGAHSLATPGWPSNSPASPLFFPQAPPRPHASLDPSHFGLQGALPHPDRSLRGAQQQQQEALVGLPTPPGPFGSALHSITGRAASMSQAGLVLHPSDIPPSKLLRPTKHLALLDSASTIHLYVFSPPRLKLFRNHPKASSARRLNYVVRTRTSLSDHAEDDSRQAMAESVEGRPSRRASQGSPQIPWDEAAMRQLQLARGAAASKMVASRAALQSLQSVNVNDLSHNEKMCVICYNDYGVESPEGINEAPLRLPKCKHVFGEHCIKKWFEDSDSCPYCRDKLPSEPKPNHGSARTFLNMMRLRGYPLPTG
ncbi:ring finger domain-containing protein [Hirsutella rhossiliensis]